MPAPLWETDFYPDGSKNGFGGVQGRGVERSWIQGLSMYDAHAVNNYGAKCETAPAGGNVCLSSP